MILTEGHPGLTDTLNGDKLTQEVFDGQALDHKPSRLRRKSLFLEFALLGTVRHGVRFASFAYLKNVKSDFLYERRVSRARQV